MNWIHFSKEEMQVTSRHMKRCSASLIIREIQVKACAFVWDSTSVVILRWWNTTSHWLEWLSSKRTQIINVGEDVERKKTLVPCWLEWTYVQPLWKTVWKFLKKWKKRTTTWFSSPTPGHIFGENTDAVTELSAPTVGSSTVTIARPWKCLWADDWRKKMLCVQTHTLGCYSAIGKWWDIPSGAT